MAVTRSSVLGPCSIGVAAAHAAGSSARISKEFCVQSASVPDGDATPPRSIPETWVTPYSGDMGNSFGPKGLLIGSRRHVSSSKYPKS